VRGRAQQQEHRLRLRLDRQGRLTHPVASEERFIQDALENRHNRAILDRLAALALPDAWLVAGCLFQTVWNLRSGAAPDAGIKDYDLFYFDASDLSASAEAAVQRRVQDGFADLGVQIEIKNQARVHTWYPSYFGYPYAPLTCSRDGLDRFLVRCTCVGLQPTDDGLVLYAPHGLDDLYAGILQPNPLCDHPPLFTQKALSYQSRWHWLEIRG
jgi:uncharacterized protein